MFSTSAQMRSFFFYIFIAKKPNAEPEFQTQFSANKKAADLISNKNPFHSLIPFFPIDCKPFNW